MARTVRVWHDIIHQMRRGFPAVPHAGSKVSTKRYIEHYLPHLVRFVADWLVLEGSTAPRIQFMTFESFLSDPIDYYGRTLAFCDIDPARFSREAEAEVVHLRKGRVDEWRDVYSAAQRRRAWDLIPEPLSRRFGWEY